MDIKKRIIAYIAAYTNYETGSPFGVMPSDINEDQIICTYGSQEEINQMIAAIEQRFDVVILPPSGKDIGEMTVREIVDVVCEMLLDDND